MSHASIKTFNDSLSPERKQIADRLFDIIDTNLNATEKKIWHAHPVWFIDGDPVVGYSPLKDSM